MSFKFDFTPSISDYTMPDDHVLDDKFHYRYISGLNVTANRSGVFGCEVCRKFDPDNESAKLTCNK